MARTTVNLDADLLKVLKRRDACEGTTMSRLVNTLVRDVLPRPGEYRPGLRLPIVLGMPRSGSRVKRRRTR